MTPLIGAGTIIEMCDAVNPMSSHTTGIAGDDANLDNVTEYFNSANFSTSMAAVDVTKLDVGELEEWARQSILGLRNSTSSGNYGDDVQGTFFRRLWEIGNGTGHADGRGKADFRILVGGAATGNLQIDGTAIFTQLDMAIEVETPIGGSYSIQCDGKLGVSVQP